MVQLFSKAALITYSHLRKDLQIGKEVARTYLKVLTWQFLDSKTDIMMKSITHLRSESQPSGYKV